jgi:hypothetical protein
MDNVQKSNFLQLFQTWGQIYILLSTNGLQDYEWGEFTEMSHASLQV